MAYARARTVKPWLAATMTASLPQRGDVVYAFSTPILMRSLPDSARLNAELQELVLAKERESKGVTKSNSGGWQSEQGLFHWQNPAIAELQQRVRQATVDITSNTCGEALQGLAVDMHINGWANVSRDRSYNRVHAHSDCTWSGVYYLSVGEPEPGVSDNGSIEFLDLHMAAQSGPAQLPGRPYRRPDESAARARADGHVPELALPLGASVPGHRGAHLDRLQRHATLPAGRR